MFDVLGHDRNKLRIGRHNYDLPRAYYITICVEGMEMFFGEVLNGEMCLSDEGKIAEKCWQDIPIHFPYVKLDEYVVMPNHIHGPFIINMENVIEQKCYCQKLFMVSNHP